MASTPAVSPIALLSGEGEAIWSFGVLATIKASSDTTAGRVAVIEHLAPQGAGSPLHVHHREDEWFYVTEGELTFWAAARVIEGPRRVVRLPPPRCSAHLPRQLTRKRASCSSVEPAGFEGFVRGDVRAGRRTLTLPPAGRCNHPRQRADDGHGRQVRPRHRRSTGVPA